MGWFFLGRNIFVKSLLFFLWLGENPEKILVDVFGFFLRISL